MVLAIANVNRAALNKHSMRPCEFARKRITVWTVTPLACELDGTAVKLS